MTEKIESREKPEMNLLTNFSAVISAMAEIEGRDWADGQRKECEQAEQGKKNYTDMDVNIAGAMKYLADVQRRIDEETDEEEKKYLKENRENYSYVVYGGGGWNRWFVNGQGDVKFSKYHATPVDIDKEKLFKKVRDLGFEVV